MQIPFQDVITAATTYLSDIDPVMRETIQLVGPCTLQPDPDIFNALIDAIISQQISVKAADAIMNRVRTALPGQKVTPEALATLDFDALRSLGLSTPKARYIGNLVEHVTTGQLQLAQLAELSDEEVINQLTAVKGIGIWTAQMSLIFTFGRPDVLPIDDLGFLEGIKTAYQLPERPTRIEARDRGELWRPYRTFATWYMWAIRRITVKNERPRTRIVSL
ncbi:DNA-3-methyladenine glycosylase family protein [Tengunoibacter tsumagoiensis]|uniref:DNA-3-methyladenine glycosylase II n=1 Tax=Tengunoibacter tsumagoiensis TaxID=2014871 RepID=A0A402A4H0_9CHLR|nr:DNA-3-methyladenine glycosylase [Tengunoibacter tsumagoiensis]GCE14047.1 DNA-3-methyladenine glycosylase II [Tengunoibacter tsumagoiensis]